MCDTEELPVQCCEVAGMKTGACSTCPRPSAYKDTDNTLSTCKINKGLKFAGSLTTMEWKGMK